MADQEPATGGNGSGEVGAEPAISILAQYTKDLSVENPSAPQVFQWQVQPNLDVQFNINVETVADDVHEVVLKIEVNARSDNGVHFVVDLSYGGLFGIRNVPADALQPFLLIEAPRLIFPFARQVVAEAVSSSGFPPLLLDPIDFAGSLSPAIEAQQRPGVEGGNGGGEQTRRKRRPTPDAGRGADRMNLARSLGSVGGLTFASRVLGLVRDMLFAQFVGANFASDAFAVAWRMPNMFRALFAEGAFSAAFIPHVQPQGRGQGRAGAPGRNRLCRRCAVGAAAIAGRMTLLLELFAWPATYLISLGFHGASHEQFAYAVMLTRFTFPYLMLISLASLLGGILNSLHKFWVAAAAPILLNIAQIVALLFFHTHEPLSTTKYQAISVTVGGALQLVCDRTACWANHVRLKLKRPTINADVRRLMKLIGTRRRRHRCRSVQPADFDSLSRPAFCRTARSRTSITPTG